MLSKFFINCSGAHKEILDQCPTEKNKFIGIGATIFITALLASISGGYFLTFVFSNKESGLNEFGWFFVLIFGLLWGFLIFNLDRNIIVSIKKTGVLAEELKQSWLRIVLAIFIGLVIATPIELKLFEGEISAKVEENLKTQVEQNRAQNIGTYKTELNLLTDEINLFRGDIKNIEPRKIKLYNEYKAEVEGSGGTFKAGKGPVYREKKEEFDKVELEYERIKDELISKEKEKNLLMNKIKGIGDSDEKRISKIDGPEARVKALYQLSGIHWFVTILLILIETLPIFIKIMSKRGPYDEILDRVEYEHYLTQQRIISEKNDELNNILIEMKELNKMKGEIRMKTETSKLDIELKTNEVLLDEIAHKQAELAKVAIDKWYQDELNRINTEPKNPYVDDNGQPNQKTQASNGKVSSKQKPSIVDVWKAVNLKDEVLYNFKNGKSNNGQNLVYTENGKSESGSWKYLNSDNEININLSKFSETYLIENLTGTSVTLKAVDDSEIELEKFEDIKIGIS